MVLIFLNKMNYEKINKHYDILHKVARFAINNCLFCQKPIPNPLTCAKHLYLFSLAMALEMAKIRTEIKCEGYSHE